MPEIRHDIAQKKELHAAAREAARRLHAAVLAADPRDPASVEAVAKPAAEAVKAIDAFVEACVLKPSEPAESEAGPEAPSRAGARRRK